jgi:hypothetical protein
MSRPHIIVSSILLLVLSLVFAVACNNANRAASTSASTSARPVPPETAGSALPAVEPAPTRKPTARDVRALRTDDPYQRVAILLAQRGVRIWWESDLVARWLDGPASFSAAVQRLGMLAKTRGTAGFKIADEIGYYDELESPAQTLRFLRDADTALGKVAPGKPILVDAVVLELGCLPRSSGTAECEHKARTTAPASTISAVTSYLRAGLIDRLDLSTGLGEPSDYPDKDLAAAQDLAWTYVAAGSWPELTHLQSRKALAKMSGYSGSAAADIRVFVDTPRRHGALATDIWTWRQKYKDQTVSLFGNDPTRNPLWKALLAERSQGVSLFTHMTPSALPTSPAQLATEIALASQIFTDVFVAAGTG